MQALKNVTHNAFISNEWQLWLNFRWLKFKTNNTKYKDDKDNKINPGTKQQTKKEEEEERHILVTCTKYDQVALQFCTTQ